VRLPDELKSYNCGTARETSTTMRTNRLQNDVNYAVAVVAQDSLGNAGDVSEIECGRPTELDDFFELYSRAGGPGGGGFCSLSPGRVGATGHPGGLALLLLVGAGLGLRRRKGAA
jgi:MYXO-CTERM domain-containing protein